uniref:hypothetical protein n=1 Tax=Crenothrix polyspora TaxID=360316 RepID=UPI001177DD0E
MASDKNLLQQFVKIVRDVLDPFVQMIGGTLEDKKEALASLGLDPSFANSSPAVPNASLNSINLYVEKSADQVDELAFFAVLEDLILISAVIKEFFAAASADNPNLTASEITTAHMNLLTLNYIRLRSPSFFKVVSVIENLDQQSIRTGGILNLIETIGIFFKRVVEGFELENETQAHDLSNTFLMVGGVGLTLLNKLFQNFEIPLSIDAAYG